MQAAASKALQVQDLLPLLLKHVRVCKVTTLRKASTLEKLRKLRLEAANLGFPCQDISVAGKREGFGKQKRCNKKKTRSALFYKAMYVITKLPTVLFLVVANCPGWFYLVTSSGMLVVGGVLLDHCC